MSEAHRILVPTDGSEHAAKALAFALSMAKRGLRIELHLLNVQPAVRGVAAAFGCTVEIDFHRFNQPTVNDPAMAALARAAAAEVVGPENVRDDVRTMGGEDYSAFLRKIPGCFIAVGSRPGTSRMLTWMRAVEKSGATSTRVIESMRSVRA